MAKPTAAGFRSHCCPASLADAAAMPICCPDWMQIGMMAGCRGRLATQRGPGSGSGFRLQGHSSAEGIAGSNARCGLAARVQGGSGSGTRRPVFLQLVLMSSGSTGSIFSPEMLFVFRLLPKAGQQQFPVWPRLPTCTWPAAAPGPVRLGSRRERIRRGTVGLPRDGDEAAAAGPGSFGRLPAP